MTNLTLEDAILYLSTQHAVVRFYRDDEDGAEMVRVVIEDETEEHRTVVKKQTNGEPVLAFLRAVEIAKTEFEAVTRRATFRAVR